MNEETIFEKRPVFNGQQEDKQGGGSWKNVTLGGVSGILMGAGAMYASQAFGKESSEENNEDENATNEQAVEGGLKVAQSHDEMSFGDAFAAAREEVGPGGVFHWHGGIYNTYTSSEWDAMSLEQKNDFAQQVQPEIHPDELSTPTDANTHVVVVHHVHHEDNTHGGSESHETPDTEGVSIIEQRVAQNFDAGEGVHIVGFADANGHLVVGYDATGDGQADVAIIDMDDSLSPSDTDVIVDREGNMAHLGELNHEDPNQLASMENPDVAQDMPDYMNEVGIDT